jgi:hypothetical protein
MGQSGNGVFSCFERDEKGNMRTVELTFTIASNGNVAAEASAL